MVTFRSIVLSLALLLFAVPTADAGFKCLIVIKQLLGLGDIGDARVAPVATTEKRITSLPKKLKSKGYWLEPDVIASPYGSDAKAKETFDAIYAEVPNAIRAPNSIKSIGDPIGEAADIQQLERKSLQIRLDITEDLQPGGEVVQRVNGVFFATGGLYRDTEYFASPKMIELLQPAINMMMAKRDEVAQSMPVKGGIERGQYRGSFVLDKPGTSRAADKEHIHEKVQMVSNVQIGDSRGTEFPDGTIVPRNQWVHFGPKQPHRSADKVPEDGDWRWVAVIFHKPAADNPLGK